MEEPQVTRVSLLLRLRDTQDGQAWSDFVDLYSPVVYGFARRQGLQDADAADLVQDVLRSVANSIGRYEREKGRFRNWLMTVVRRRLSDLRVVRGRDVAGSGDTGVHRQLESAAAEEEDRQAWEQEYQQSLFQLASARVRDVFEQSTWQAFWQTSMEARSTRDVARGLGLTEGAVYIARSRVLARLKKEIELLEQ